MQVIASLLISILFLVGILSSVGEGKGTFSIKILELTNYAKKRMDGTCCGSSLQERTKCEKKCVLEFRICVDYLNAIVDQNSLVAYRGDEQKPSCLYGEKSTNHWGDTDQKYMFQKAIEYQLEMRHPWPRSFALILEAYDIVDTSQKFLVDRLVHRGVLLPVGQTSGWHEVQALTPRSLGFGFHMKMDCAEQYYNSTCTMRCDPSRGQFSCGPNGEKVCHLGWMGDDCKTPICKVGCHDVHGSCDKPGECNCANGWQGAYCDDCIKYPGCKHGTCNNSPFTCKCFLNWGGPFCDKDLNYCGRQRPCKNGGICKNLDSSASLKQYRCICPRGFDGENCEIKLDPCTLSPCKRGSCRRSVNSYRCTCDSGWTGINCDTNINECEENSCRNGGTCIDLDQPGFNCSCPPGFKGSVCQLRNPCSNSHCSHAHECNLIPDSNGDYECVCQPGWTGRYCDENIDDCKPGICRNNGTCKDLIHGYYCECPRSYTGRNCEINQVCASSPCLNSGICTNTDNNGFMCQCPEGYTGLRCEIAHSGCNPNPCLHGAYCYNLENDFYCQCTDQFYGKRCEHPRPYCEGSGGDTKGECETAPDPCSQRWGTGLTRRGQGGEGRLGSMRGICDYGVCLSLGGNRYRCDCEPGYEGTHCQINANDCRPESCMNNGTCLDNTRDFDCLCLEGFEGKRCEIQIDLCKTNPCRNGGICRSLPNDFLCECPTQYWTGRWCELANDDPCREQHTCFNEGHCVQEPSSHNGFQCRCNQQWTGSVCHIKRQEYTACYSKPCHNGGTCVNVGNDYNCVCKEGFQGKQCETNVNECNPMPCYHNSTCIDMINSYECRCQTGFGGADCQININDCASNPCAYGATCIDKVARFECRCPEGRQGRLCELMVLGLPPKPPSCLFHRRLYDNGQTWVYNCQRCTCTMGNITCQDEFCGKWSCLNAVGPDDRYACKPGQVCHAINTEVSNCFVQPCYPKATCINSGDRPAEPRVPWAADAGPGCRPNSNNLNNNCARLLLSFNRAHLPYGVTVNDVCQAVRDLEVVRRRQGRVEMGISCDVSVRDDSTIDVSVSSPSNRVELRGGAKQSKRPIVHEIVRDIASSLERLESNSSALVGVLTIRVETQLRDETEWGSRYLIPIFCTVICFFGALAIVLLLVYHRRQKRRIRMKYAPYTTVNNVRDGTTKPRLNFDSSGGGVDQYKSGAGTAEGRKPPLRRQGGDGRGVAPTLIASRNKNINIAAARNISGVGLGGEAGGQMDGRFGRDGEVVV